MRVLLAGGGTAGHTSPLLATADALRRRDPTIEITALGTPRGLENRVVPAAGYPLELVPPVPLSRSSTATCCAPRCGCGRGQGRARGDRPGAARRGGGLRRLRVGAGLPRRAPQAGADRRARGQRARRHREQAGRPVHPHVATSFPGTELPSRALRRAADPADDRTLDRGELREEASRAFGLDPDRPTLLVTGGSQGARRLNESVAAAAPAFAAAGVQVLHILGPDRRGRRTRKHGRRARRTSRCRSSTGWTSRTPPPTPSVPGRQQHGHRGVRRGTARDLRAAADRQRRAGPQRPPRGRRGRRAARRRRAPSPPSGWPRPSPTCSPTAPRLAAHVACGRRRDPARRRRQARRDDPGGSAEGGR